MKVQGFIHRHYSTAVGESPVGHIVAVLAGITLMAIGGVLVASVVFIPLGGVIALIGIGLFAAAVVGHIRSPFTLSDALDAVVGLTGAAIAGMFALVIAAMVLGLAFTALFEIVQWIVQ